MSGGGSISINDLKHPQFSANAANYEKFRLTYQSGTRFIQRYLKKFSNREDDQAFAERRAISYVPAFAKAAVDEVRNSIFQRLTDIIREGGPSSYQAAVEGYGGGVDRAGSSMTTFMGRDVLPELLSISRVGVYVDMPPLPPDVTLAEKGEHHRPYLYWYKAEDIRSWAVQDTWAGDPQEFRSILLRDSTYDLDQHWVLPNEVTHRYRHLWIGDDGFVHAQFYRESVSASDGAAWSPGTPDQGGWIGDGEEVVLNIRRIPFVILELGNSLLIDAADYQIALLNLASADINYALKSNYPFYVEQYDWKADTPYLKQPVPGGMTATHQSSFDPVSSTIMVNQEKAKEIKVGTASGRRYPLGAERPGFIHPSSEPLDVSMRKQEQLKTEIRQLVQLAVSSLSSTRRSAESMGLDNQGLEAGLSYIGLELQHAERKIASYWAMYEGAEGASVNYPTQYSILSDSDRRAAAAELQALLPMVPSLTFRREVAKRIVDTILGSKVKRDVLQSIKDEIDKDPVVLGDPKVIETDVVNGLVDLNTASAARGYPAGVVEKAKIEHGERLARIATSQASAAGLTHAAKLGVDMGARGVPDLSANPQAASQEKAPSQVDQTNRDQVAPRTRGEGK